LEWLGFRAGFVVSKFLTPLWLEHVDGNVFIVCAPFRYESDLLRGILIVPTGTMTDLASIPRVFRGLLPKSGRYNPAATLHDAGLTGCLRTITDQRINLIKKYADLVFLEAMEVAGVGRLQRQLMYRLVKRFGKTSDPSGQSRAV